MTYIITKSIFPEDKERLKKNLIQKYESHKHLFRLFDADGNLYFEGLSTKMYSFDPPNDEMVNSGCTEIKHLDENKYMTT